MRVAVIGAGGMGGSLGRLLARAGHEVVFAGSRNPQKLAHAVELAGPNARTDRMSDAIEDAGIVVIAVPFDRYPDVARQAGPSLRDQVVLDTSNPITMRDGRVEFLTVPDGLTAAAHQQRTLGPVRLVKAFNLICASQIDQLATRVGDQQAAVLFVGNEPAAKQTVARLITDAGFIPVDAGALADATVIELASVDDWPPTLTGDEARRLGSRSFSVPTGELFVGRAMTTRTCSPRARPQPPGSPSIRTAT